MTQTASFLRSVPLFETCSAEDIQRMALGLRWHSYKKGDTILHQGVISHQMFFLAHGAAAVFARQGRETRQVGRLEAGSYFGEISLLTSSSATATIKADADDTQVYVLERDVLIDALSRHPAAMADVTRRVQERNQNRADAFQQVETPAPTPA